MACGCPSREGGRGAPPQRRRAATKRRARRHARATSGSKESRFYRPIDRTYTWLLRWSMAHRWAVVLMCVAVILSIVPLFMLRRQKLPARGRPVAVRGQRARARRRDARRHLGARRENRRRHPAELPGVTDTLVTIGGGQQEQVNIASIYVKLAPIEERDQSQDELMVAARDLLRQVPAGLAHQRPAGGGHLRRRLPQRRHPVRHRRPRLAEAHGVFRPPARKDEDHPGRGGRRLFARQRQARGARRRSTARAPRTWACASATSRRL